MKQQSANITRIYELSPDGGRKSFYGKAKVLQLKNGDEMLYSYDTAIVKRKKSGELLRIWDDWSQTTGRHIKAFCGLNKAGFDQLPFEN